MTESIGREITRKNRKNNKYARKIAEIKKKHTMSFENLCSMLGCETREHAKGKHTIKNVKGSVKETNIHHLDGKQLKWK